LTGFDEKIETLVRDLPDAEGARLFFERISTEHPTAFKALARDIGLLSDTLALAAWSPLLATTLAQNPEYLSWLARERTHTRIKTLEEFGESLARFSLTNSQLSPQILLARFRRRELLRIYLHDIRRTSTLVETTEELSNLADAVLAHALDLARQDLDNLYGPPQKRDEKGRGATASFCIVALGKLGSHELNYASDIDLLFLYSDDGMTAGRSQRGETTNREYFIKLAETIARIVGQPAGEGAAYRVDLRLRPHGRDGALASSLAEAVRYYTETAQAWERQALIRARAAAGSGALYARFAAGVSHRVYAAEETVGRALAHVRLAKQKIDRHHAHDTGGFNVKLGRGGIREIEFIAQALQLAFGGRDEWLRAPHTLISLGRLADRRHIKESERAQLSDAYVFLRILEHRLQMEHGLQTHSVPDDPARRSTVARRMGFNGETALSDFDSALQLHKTSVRAVYDRVFAETSKQDQESKEDQQSSLGHPFEASASKEPVHSKTGEQEDSGHFIIEPSVDAEALATTNAARIFTARLERSETKEDGASLAQVESLLRDAAQASLNSHRALMLTSRVASSLDKAPAQLKLSLSNFKTLVNLCGASEFFGELLAANPALISTLPAHGSPCVERNYRALLYEAVEGEESFGAELSSLRRAWSRLLVETGALDAAGEINMREANRCQTELAAASLDAGCLVARRELARRYGELDADAKLAVLGLGRLGGGSMDYGSDLDVVLIYDDAAPSPIHRLSHLEAYGRLSELLVAAISSVTRDGYLYRVDLRLRPDGRNGATCSGSGSFTDYLRERAVPWEWLAYVKLRAAAGALELGRKVEAEARGIIHEAARLAGDESLRTETRRVRERLEHEKGRRRGRAGIDIKYGPGGMLDVYFATRYLQLRDDVPDESKDRSTRATLERLRAAGSLSEQDFKAMSDGYPLLRTLDHSLRLIVGRSTRLPATDHPALRDIARSLAYPSPAALKQSLTTHMQGIRAAYDHITKG
jgi:[glutamine synthetase] adenylyltransferase / [glutamine synthetase]-adenylyl-L-tyrosine phosphorylase